MWTLIWRAVHALDPLMTVAMGRAAGENLGELMEHMQRRIIKGMRRKEIAPTDEEGFEVRMVIDLVYAPWQKISSVERSSEDAPPQQTMK